MRQWRELQGSYRSTLRETISTGQHTPSAQDLEPEFMAAMGEFLQGDPLSEPVFEVDALGPVGGESGKRENDEVLDDLSGRVAKKARAGTSSLVIKELKESTESYMKESAKHREKMTSILEKNSDLLAQLVNFITKKE
jgi:hypothetical protein